MAAIDGGTSGNYLVQWHGPYRATTYTEGLPIDIYCVPSDALNETPRLYAKVWYTITRPGGERSSTLNVTINGKLLRSSLDTAYFGYQVILHVKIGDTTKQIAYKAASPNQWSDIQASNVDYNFNVGWGSNNRIPIQIISSGHCLIAGKSPCGAGDYTATIINASVPHYNPYTASSVGIETKSGSSDYDYTKIARISDGNASSTSNTSGRYYIKYKYNAGTNTNLPLNIIFHDWGKTSWSPKWETELKKISNKDTESATSYYTLGNKDVGKTTGEDKNKFEAANRYRVAIGTYKDNNYESIAPPVADISKKKPSEGLDIYTYREPYVSDISMTNTTFSPHNNPEFKFSVNGRRWADFENDFKTKMNLKNKDTWDASDNSPTRNDNSGVGTTKEITSTITQNYIINQYSKEERSVEKINTTLYASRISPGINTTGYTKAEFSATKSTNVVIQFKPTKTPSSVTVNSNNKNVAGKTISVQSNKTINVAWSYPTTTVGTGTLNGYLVTVYKKVNNTEVTVIATKDVAASVANPGASLSITTSNLAIGVMNYIKIVPYYKKPYVAPGTDAYITGSNIYSGELVKPVNSLTTPEIEYPKHNKTWLNKNFRILFTLPTDADFNVIGKSTTEYTYADIEVIITPVGKTERVYKFSNNTHNAYFSCSNLKGYTKAVAFNPSADVNLPDVTSYKMKVRVKKNYIFDTTSTEEEKWSAWSSEHNINISKISEFNISSGNKVMLTHYKTPRDLSVKIREAYPFSNLPVNNAEKKQFDKIEYKNYQGIYDTIKAIQTGVNGYCTYNHTAVKLNENINAFDSPNQPKKELITAAKNPSNLDGRNYPNIIIQEMNKLV